MTSRRLLPEEVIEIRDPAIDVAAIMDEIRAGLASRGYTEQDEAPDFPVFSPDGFPGPNWLAQLDLDPEISYLLEQAGAGHNRLAVSMDVRRPQVPVGGEALFRFKRAAHELAIFYVNQLGARQVQVNIHLLRAVARVAADQAALKRENARLRERLSRLEELSQTNGG